MSGALSLTTGGPNIWPNPLTATQPAFSASVGLFGPPGYPAPQTVDLKLATDGGVYTRYNGGAWAFVDKWAPVVHPLAGHGLWLSMAFANSSISGTPVYSNGWTTSGYVLMTSDRIFSATLDAYTDGVDVYFTARISRDGGATSAGYNNLCVANFTNNY